MESWDCRYIDFPSFEWVPWETQLRGDLIKAYAREKDTQKSTIIPEWNTFGMMVFELFLGMGLRFLQTLGHQMMIITEGLSNQDVFEGVPSHFAS